MSRSMAITTGLRFGCSEWIFRIAMAFGEILLPFFAPVAFDFLTRFFRFHGPGCRRWRSPTSVGRSRRASISSRFGLTNQTSETADTSGEDCGGSKKPAYKPAQNRPHSVIDTFPATVPVQPGNLISSQNSENHAIGKRFIRPFSTRQVQRFAVGHLWANNGHFGSLRRHQIQQESRQFRHGVSSGRHSSAKR